MFDRRYLKDDMLAGVVVYLVALPLCLGVALASNAPLFSGIIAGVVGGIVVTVASGSALGVSGPAAGLAVIVAAAITKLGYDAFLLAVVFCGLLQIALGYLRAGVISHYFPTAVIKGMLAGIGVIMILKQIPHLLGNDTSWMGELKFLEQDGHNSFSELYYTLLSIHPVAIGIGLVSLAILIIWDGPLKKSRPGLSVIPAALIVVIVGTLINEVVRIAAPGLALAGDALVRLPEAESFGEFLNFLRFPDISQIGNSEVYIVAITLAVIASVETLLSAEAADKLDPQKRVTPTNRELKAQGIGNLISGLLGGIPVTQVIVRSATNVSAGGKTKSASFFHGFLLLISAMLIPTLLNRIPLACLAAILTTVGYKLSKLEIYREMYRQGWQQFFPFIATVLGLLFTDMLVGVCLGLLVGVFHILLYNYRTNYWLEVDEEANSGIVHLSEHMSFLNKAALTKVLWEIEAGVEVTIDGSRSVMLDYDVKEVLKYFLTHAQAIGITVHFKGIDQAEIADLQTTGH
ncbi:Na(+)-dependent bicarbonate transporter BicA [Olavius algarvensis Delta 1 endosymbiont]|nr:Na(+)-dependent bicarbonate transporter BicA [Olavius algarvensis Delta 1 endosymbiont]